MGFVGVHPAVTLGREGKRTDPFYQSRAWQSLRARAVRIAQWRCMWCGADVRPKGAARVDHVRPRRERPDLALVITNLRVLCSACDNRRHSEKGGREVYRYDADGLPLDPRHHWNRKR